MSTALEDQVAKVSLGDVVEATWSMVNVPDMEGLDIEVKATDVDVTEDMLKKIQDGTFSSRDEIVYKLISVRVTD